MFLRLASGLNIFPSMYGKILITGVVNTSMINVYSGILESEYSFNRKTTFGVMDVAFTGNPTIISGVILPNISGVNTNNLYNALLSGYSNLSGINVYQIPVSSTVQFVTHVLEPNYNYKKTMRVKELVENSFHFDKRYNSVVILTKRNIQQLKILHLSDA